MDTKTDKATANNVERSPAWAVAVATLIGNFYIVCGSLFFAALAVLAGPFGQGRLTYRVGRVWARGLLASGLLRLRVEGREQIDPAERYIFMANHQSLFDIPAMYAALPGRVAILAKKSLFQVPVFGWSMKLAGFIPVDRKDRSQAKSILEAAIARLAAGRSVMLFPEETRSLDGDLLPFQRGGFLIALKSGRPIVPVGIEGAFAVQARHSFVIRPRTVHVRFGAPIPVAGLGVRQKDELIERVHTEVAALARCGRGAQAETGAVR